MMIERYPKGFFIGLFFIPLLFFIGCHKGVEADSTAPDFILSDINNRPISLRDYRGRVVILDFWATWCYACRMSIPELIRLQNEYGEKGLFILSISLDSPDYISNNDLMRFKEALGINYKILRGNIKVIEDYFGDQKPMIPTMFIIDRNGRIKAKIIGFNPIALRQVLGRLLK